MYTLFLLRGANPTRIRPPVVMLLFSDVPECAPDWRGRSHVGHTHTLQLELFFPPGLFKRSVCEESQGSRRSLASYLVHLATPPLRGSPPSLAVYLQQQKCPALDPSDVFRVFRVSLLQSGPAQRRSASAAKLVFAT